MLKWFAKRRLDAFERAFEYDVSYMREMIDVSWRGFRRFSNAAKLATHREGVPLGAWYAVKIVATLSEDCGPCTQLMIKMAELDGVEQSVLHGILTGDTVAMGADATLALQFSKAVLARDPQADGLRDQIVARWGKPALLSLALAMAATRLFPSAKFALGHGQACALVKVGDRETRPQILSPASRQQEPIPKTA